jgi:hypothetical protein
LIFFHSDRAERKRDKRDRSRSRDRRRDKDKKERKPEFDIKIKEEPVDGKKVEFNLFIALRREQLVQRFANQEFLKLEFSAIIDQ